MIKSIASHLISLSIIIFLTGLALLAYLGFYNRYWSDDWCYSADARQLGTINATLQYFSKEGTGYSPNRYSLTFLSALTENTIGMPGNQVYGLLTIVLWLTGIIWVLYNITRHFTSIPLKAILFASALLLYYNLYISPQRFQILYWRSGVLPYSTALIFWLLILGLITHQLTREATPKWVYYLIASLAFISAGLGEISTTLMVSGTSILLISIWIAKHKKLSWADKIYSPTLIAWIFFIVGMLTLIISPSNARIEDMSVERTSLIDVPLKATINGMAFIIISLRTLPFPHIIFLMMALGLSFLTYKDITFHLTFHEFLIVLAVSILITIALIIAIHTPTAYFYSAPPDPRGKSLARFILLAGLGFTTYLSGNWTASKFDHRLLSSISVLILLLGLVYTIRSISLIYKELPGFIQRAEIWDERDATIKSEKQKGNLLIEVPAIDTADIDTRDMFRSKGKGWITYELNCAARYYGVDGLKVKQ